MSKEKNKNQIVIWKFECPLCGFKTTAMTEKAAHKKQIEHVDKDCKVAKICRYAEEEFPGATLADVVWLSTGKKIKGRKIFKGM